MRTAQKCCYQGVGRKYLPRELLVTTKILILDKTLYGDAFVSRSFTRNQAICVGGGMKEGKGWASSHGKQFMTCRKMLYYKKSFLGPVAFQALCTDQNGALQFGKYENHVSTPNNDWLGFIWRLIKD